LGHADVIGAWCPHRKNKAMNIHKYLLSAFTLGLVACDAFNEGYNRETHRLATARPASLPPMAAPAEQPPAPPLPVWFYTHQRDEMRGTTIDVACAGSTNRLQFRFPYAGGATAHVCLRQTPGIGLDAWVSIDRGQFVCHRNCSIQVKIDDGPVTEWSVSRAESGTPTMMFVDDAQRFLAAVRRARRVVIEGTFYQVGPQQMVFEDVSGLEWPDAQ